MTEAAKDKVSGRRKREKRPDVHVYLSQDDRDQIEAWAEQECRSLTGQVLHILREALTTRRLSIEAQSQLSPAERVRHGTRRAIAEARARD